MTFSTEFLEREVHVDGLAVEILEALKSPSVRFPLSHVRTATVCP